MSTTAPTTAAHRGTATSPPSLARLTSVEVRKVLDTRSGRWFLLAVLALAAAALANYLVSSEAPFTFGAAFDSTRDVVRLLLPVLGVLSMTGEWTQRTALTTFALVPQRGRVLAAKIAAVLVVTVVVVLLVAAACAGSVLLAATATGTGADLGGVGREVGEALVESALWMLMGAGIGALVQSTAAALVVFLLAPTFVSAAAVLALGDARGAWVNVVTAVDQVSHLHLPSPAAAPITAIVLWVVLPLVAGTVRTLRRQVV